MATPEPKPFGAEFVIVDPLLERIECGIFVGKILQFFRFIYNVEYLVVRDDDLVTLSMQKLMDI